MRKDQAFSYYIVYNILYVIKIIGIFKIMQNRFVIDQKFFYGLLSSIQPICSKKTVLDTTSNILFALNGKELILKSTDLEISLQANCSLIENNIIESRQFLVSGKRIFEVVKELEGPISCLLENHQLTLQANDVNFSLNIKETQEFPPFPERIENLLSLDSKLLLSMVESVAFLIPQNNVNQALNGLFFEIAQNALIMTTTDGHCLAQATSPFISNSVMSWLLPRRAIHELKKILETCPDETIFLGTCSNQLVFSGEFFNFFTKLLVDQFPSYSAILDKSAFLPATVDRAKLIKTVKRSTCLLSGNFLATKFAFEPNLLRVSINNKEVGTLDEQIAVNGVKDAIDIRFYSPYLLNGLQALSGSEVTFYLKSSVNPIIFEYSDDKYLMTYLVMPVSPNTL